ncbi:hypothetical protein S83_045844, partial [Arachis hypogaea]
FFSARLDFYTQNIGVPMMLSSWIATALHAALCWALVLKYDLGRKGATISNCILYWVNVLIIALYIKFFPKCSKTWTGFSVEAFHNIPSFSKTCV